MATSKPVNIPIIRRRTKCLRDLNFPRISPISENDFRFFPIIYAGNAKEIKAIKRNGNSKLMKNENIINPKLHNKASIK